MNSMDENNMITINGNIIINHNFPKNNNKDVEIDLKKIRNSNDMKVVKKKVKGRDNYCRCCGERDKKLQVHHILPLSKYPELSTNEDNLICLCQKCHNKYEKEYQDNINPVTFSEFMLRYGNRRFVK